MDKSKILMWGFFLVLLIVVASLGVYDIASHRGAYLQISNKLTCSTGVGYSDNPPYFVGQKHYWWIHLTVRAVVDVTDVVVSDQLGDGLMLEGLSFVSIDGPGPYNYTFEYSTYGVGGTVGVRTATTARWNFLDERGIEFEDFRVYWTGETLTAHWQWTIGTMEKDEVRDLYVTISTDLNPAGLQEFVAPATYALNAGPLVEGIVASTGLSTGAVCPGVEVEVLKQTA